MHDEVDIVNLEDLAGADSLVHDREKAHSRQVSSAGERPPTRT